MTIDELIAEARKAREELNEPARDFENEDAPEAARYEQEDRPEDNEDEDEATAPKAVDAKKRARRNGPKLSITLDKNAEALTEALYKLTAALNAIGPRSGGEKTQPREAAPVKIGITVNIEASPLVNGLTDELKAITGGRSEGALNRALRELLKDFNAPRLSAIPKGEAKRFLTMLDRRLEDGQTRPLEFTDEPEELETPSSEPAPAEDDEATESEPQETPQPRPVETPAPSRSDLRPEDFLSMLKWTERQAETPEEREKIKAILDGYGASDWTDVKPEYLGEALKALHSVFIEPASPLPEPYEVTDEEAAALIEGCKKYASQVKPEKRPQIVALLSRYGAASFNDIPRDKLTEAVNFIISIRGMED